MNIQASAATRSRPVKPPDSVALGVVTEPTLHDLADVFQILADHHRLKIMFALARNGPMHVTSLKELLGQSQPAVSHHLSLMRDKKLVVCDRKGKHNFYRLESTRVSSLLDQLFGELGNSARQIQLEDLGVTFKRK